MAAAAVRVARWRTLVGLWGSRRPDASARPVPLAVLLAGLVLIGPPALGYGSTDPYALRLAVPFALLLLATLILPGWGRLRVLAGVGTILTVPASVWLLVSSQSLIQSPDWLVAAPGATSGVGPLVPFVLVVVVLGLIWGWIARRTNSLVPSFVMHTVALVFLLMFVVGVAS